MLSYNLKRTFNILKFDDLMEGLKKWRPKYRKDWQFTQKTHRLPAFNAPTNFIYKVAA